MVAHRRNFNDSNYSVDGNYSDDSTKGLLVSLIKLVDETITMTTAKKSLGQHFLTSKNIARDIVRTANADNYSVLEIGPGKGILTEELLKNKRRVIAVEKDNNLISYLRGKFSKELESGGLVVVHNDILNVNLSKLFDGKKYIVVANIPYYITGKIIKILLSQKILPERAVLLVQKEVAERIARDKKESVLSISVKAYGEPRYVKKVKAGNFYPKPKVDSAILAIDNISRSFFKNIPEERFFEILKAGFAHKRKFLISNLLKIEDNKTLSSAFDKCDFLIKERAEDLSLRDWECLVNMLAT